MGQHRSVGQRKDSNSWLRRKQRRRPPRRRRPLRRKLPRRKLARRRPPLRRRPLRRKLPRRKLARSANETVELRGGTVATRSGIRTRQVSLRYPDTRAGQPNNPLGATERTK